MVAWRQIGTVVFVLWCILFTFYLPVKCELNIQLFSTASVKGRTWQDAKQEVPKCV